MTECECFAIEIPLSDVFVSVDVAPRLADEFGVEAVDWQSQNEELLSGLSAQSGSSIMIWVFVLVAVALGIASTLARAGCLPALAIATVPPKLAR